MGLTAAAAPASFPARSAADGLPTKFLLVVVARQRARQLQNGARPRVNGEGHKFLWIALREVLAGLVSWGSGPTSGG